MQIDFTCPKCKSTRGVEQVVVNAVVASQVCGIDEGGLLDTKVDDVCDGEIDRYQCIECGWYLGDDNFHCACGDDLFEWLKEHKMLVESA